MVNIQNGGIFFYLFWRQVRRQGNFPSVNSKGLLHLAYICVREVGTLRFSQDLTRIYIQNWKCKLEFGITVVSSTTITFFKKMAKIFPLTWRKTLKYFFNNFRHINKELVILLYCLYFLLLLGKILHTSFTFSLLYYKA